MIIQFCGMSGAGKTTLAKLTEETLQKKGLPVEIIDGDSYRQTLCKGLGFSKEDRQENIRRMAFVAAQLSKHGIICILSAINPYQETREEIRNAYPNVKLVHIDCSLQTLINRDTKGLYKKALLPEDHPDKINNLTGVNDTFETPENPDLYLSTEKQSTSECVDQLVHFIENNFSVPGRYVMAEQLVSKLVKVG